MTNRYTSSLQRSPLPFRPEPHFVPHKKQPACGQQSRPMWRCVLNATVPKSDHRAFFPSSLLRPSGYLDDGIFRGRQFIDDINFASVNQWCSLEVASHYRIMPLSLQCKTEKHSQNAHPYYILKTINQVKLIILSRLNGHENQVCVIAVNNRLIGIF